jgi:alkanesulfonate monooxygenase SsuD/methylene tetrahydromethanopterin reductase-like flavin-dependent oxidoreductase (luciferase family)
MSPLGATLYPFDLDTMALARLGREAEARGFDAVFVVEQGVSNDVMAAVEAIALATSRISVGPGIANVHLRHPALLGAAAVAVDELSGGRLILGLGTNNETMVRGLGLPWKEPRAALRETTDWIRRVFAGDTDPRIHVAFRKAAHPIPIHFGGVALETAALAGEIADGLMLYLATPGRTRQVIDRMAEAARRAGRNPGAVQVTLLVPTFLSDRLDAARAAARGFLARYAGRSLYAKMFHRSGFEAEADAIERAAARGDRAGAVAAVSDRMLDEVLLVGPLARCRERLAAFREAGIDYPLIAPQPVEEGAAAAAMRTLAAFGR